MKKIKVLVICSNMLSFSLARKIEKSVFLYKLYINTELSLLNNQYNNIEYVNLHTIKECKEFVKKKKIDLIIMMSVLNEKRGLVNYFKYNLGIPTFGITKYWLELENSKLFGKEFMEKHNIPTSKYKVIRNKKELEEAIEEYGYHFIIKDNKQQAGFGTYICRTKKDCLRIAKKILKSDKFLIAEKYIKGEEVTLHTIWDGKILLPLEPVRDYKRLKNNNEGINTGSMGSYIPVKLTERKKELINQYVTKLEKVFQEVKPNFTGVFASNLIFTEENIYNLEFNMRPCSPEFEVLLEHTDDDILEIMYKTATSELTGRKINYKSGKTGAVNIVHKEYEYHLNKCKIKKIKVPEGFLKEKDNIKINYNIIEIDKKNKAKVYTDIKIFTLIKNDIKNPFPSIYEFIKKIKDKNVYYRTDIGEN